MQFLFPGVLWGLLALSIPLIVHLFNFRRTKKIFFSNVSLLKAVDTQTSSFRKLKRWLIMAARMLFLACLILAFAQPIWFKGAAVKAQSTGINGIYIDNSLSMENVTEGKHFFDLAIIKVDELLSIFNRSSNLQLTTNDFDGQDQFVQGANKIKDRLTTLKYSEAPRTLEQVYKRQKTVANKHNPSGANHFFWFSDFQRSTVGKLSDIKVDSLDQVHIIPVLGKVSQNVFVDSVWLSVPVVREMQNNVLNVKVFNSGNTTVEKLPLKLILDGVQASTSSVNISPNAFASATFNFTVKDRGTHKAKIEFDDQPITFDNDYFFVLNASPTIRVLHLYGNKSKQDYIGKMYANDSLFNYTSASLSNVDPGVIQKADLVILEGAISIDGGVKEKLEAFIADGGSLGIIPGENISVGSYATFLGKYGIQSFSDISDVPTAQTLSELAEPEKTNIFFEGVFERAASNMAVSLPKSSPKIVWSGIANKLLVYKNGKNFLTQTKVGDGNIYILSSPLSSAYGNFQEHAYFVPTFYKMAYLSAKPERLSYRFNDQVLKFFMPDAPKNATYKLKNGNFEMIPVQRMFGKTLELTLPKSAEVNHDPAYTSGFYTLEINGQAKKVIALNHDQNESRLDVYTSDELKDIFENNQNVVVHDDVTDGSFVQAFRDTTLGTPLWKYLIVLALVFLFIEILLARFMKS